MKLRKFLLLFTSITIFCMVLAQSAQAHKVNVFAYAEGGIVYTEGYFPDGTPVKNGTIEVLDSQGTELKKGKTNSDGMWSFSVPKKDDLTIVINASMGHKNKFTLTKDELE